MDFSAPCGGFIITHKKVDVNLALRFLSLFILCFLKKGIDKTKVCGIIDW
jgi:hypothetical protein